MTGLALVLFVYFCGIRSCLFIKMAIHASSASIMVMINVMKIDSLAH